MFSFCQLPASAGQVTSRQEFVELFLSEVVMLGGLVLAHYKQLLGCWFFVGEMMEHVGNLKRNMYIYIATPKEIVECKILLK